MISVRPLVPLAMALLVVTGGCSRDHPDVVAQPNATSTSTVPQSIEAPIEKWVAKIVDSDSASVSFAYVGGSCLKFDHAVVDESADDVVKVAIVGRRLQPSGTEGCTAAGTLESGAFQLQAPLGKRRIEGGCTDAPEDPTCQFLSQS